MAIDWSQVIERPDKSFKVPGELLLQQRTKIESLQKEVENLKAAKGESDQKASALNLRIETVLGDLESKNAKISENEKKLEELKEVIAGLEDNLATSDDKQKQLAKQLEDVEKASKSKDAQISGLTNKLSELDAQVNDLQQYQAKSQELEVKLAESSGIKDQLSGKDSELAALQAKVSDFETKISALTAEKDQIEQDNQTKIKLIEDEKKSFEEQYKLKDAEVAEKEEKIKSMGSKVDEFSKIQAESAKKETEITALKKKTEELQTNLSAFAPTKPAATEGKLRETKGSGIKSTIPWKSKTGIHTCPDCGGNRTEEVQDKSKVLYVAAGTPIYAKKRRCMDCGGEWNID